MPRPRHLAPLLGAALISLSSTAGSAPALRASAELDVTAGHDDNMLLATAPDLPTTLQRLGGWFGQLSPTLGLAVIGGGFRWEAWYAGDYRWAEQPGHLYYQEGQLVAHLPALGPARLQLGLSAGRFDAWNFPEDQFVFAGGEAGLRLAVLDTIRARVRYLGQWRRLGGAVTSTDVLHAADAGLLYVPTAWLEIGPRASLLVVQPPSDNATDADDSQFVRWRGGLDGAATLGPLTATAGMWLGQVRLGTVNERQLGGQAELRLPVTAALDVFAGFEIAAPISAGASRDYARRVFLAGLAAVTTFSSRPPVAPPQTDLRPVLQPGRVRLRLKAPAGAIVHVVGSWDDWQAPGQTLTPTREPGLYEVWLPLPPGSHRYHFLVDGQARRPPDSPQYVADGFGGEDGVLDVADPPPSPVQ